MSLIRGRHALVVRESPSDYQEAVYSLGRLVERCLTFAFFYHRLEDQLRSGTLRGTDYEQARYSQIALYDSIVASLHKLVENRRDSWNLRQLYKEWCKFEIDEELQRSALAAIEDLEGKLGWLSKYRHEEVAHQSKSKKMTMLTVLPPSVPHLDLAVSTLDHFVEGEIPYGLYLHDTDERIDLRGALSL